MATIIKPNSPQYPSGSAVRDVAYRLSDMEQQADEYLHSVRAEAVKIIEQARAEADRIRQQAQVAGRQAAEEAVERILEQKVAARMTTLLPALEAAVQQVVDARHDWLRHWETRAVELAARIAERIVRSELTRRPELPAEWIAEALQLAAGSGDVTIRLHPDDYDTLAGQVAQLAEVFAPLAAARLQIDANLHPGGCRVETAYGHVDHQLETQLARIAAELSP